MKVYMPIAFSFCQKSKHTRSRLAVQFRLEIKYLESTQSCGPKKSFHSRMNLLGKLCSVFNFEFGLQTSKLGLTRKLHADFGVFHLLRKHLPLT